MQHKGTVNLETERLILRKYKLTDAQDMFNNWAGSEQVTKYLTWQAYKSVNDVQEYIKYVISMYDDNHYDWVIELKQNHQAIGSIGIINIQEDINEVTVGYCLSEKYWHKGIMTEALSALIEFFFVEVKANRISSYHDVHNPNSGGVMKKCGMKYEGTHRQADKNNTGICDKCVYAILKDDYLQ